VSKGRVFFGIAAAALCVADIVVASFASRDAGYAIGWGRVAVAIALQLVVLVILVGWSVMRTKAPAQRNDSAASYRSYVPVTLVGAVLVMTALSLDLLYTAIACPGTGIPTVRGHHIC
jgi:NADH:ubiquinone oxidoreductase subunit 2 (subunit N)